MVRWSNPTRRDGSQINWAGGGGGNSGGNSAPVVPAQTNEQRNAIFDQYRAGILSQAQAIGQLRGSAAQASFQAKVQAAQASKQAASKQAAQNKAVAEAAAKLQNIQGAVSQKKTEQQRQSLIDEGARVTTKTSRDVKTGEDLIITETRKGGRLIRDVKNVSTGGIKTTSYAPGKAGGSVGLVGGYTQSVVKQEPVVEQPTTDSSVLFSPSVDIALPKSQQDIYSQSYWSASKQFVGNIFSNVKTFFTGKEHKYEDVLAPFDYAGTPKPEQIAEKGIDMTYDIPKFGTISPGESGFETITINREDKTFRQVQGEIETARVLYPNETFQDVPDFFTHSGSRIKNIVPTVVDIGVTTGLSIVATPLAGAGYMTFRGVQYAAKGKYKDVYSGTELYSGVREMSPESKQAGLYLGFAAIAAIGQPGRIAKEIDVLRYEAAMNAPSKTVGKLYNINDEKWLKTVTRKQTSYYKEETNIDVPIFMKDKGKFNIGVGQGEQSVKFLPFSEQVGDKGWQIYSKEFVTAGRGTVNPIIINDMLLPEKYAVTTGEGYFTLKDTRVSKSFGFGGVTKDVGKAYTGKGGKITSTRVYGKVWGNIEVTPTEIIIPLKTAYNVPLKDTSLIFKELPKVTDDFGLTITKDVGRKSSKSFLSQLYKQEARVDVGSFASSVSSGVSGTSQIVQPSGVSLIVPPIIPRLSNEVKHKQFQQPLLLNKPSSAAAVKQTPVVRVTPMVIQIPRSSNRLSSRNKSITRQVPKLKSITKNIVAQQTGQLTKQKQLTQQKQVFGGAFNFPIRTPFTPAPTPPPKPPIIIIPKFSKSKQPTKTSGGFQVLGRRFGKFKVIGVGRTEREAFSLGKKFASSTLGATFKVPKSKVFKLPGYKTKQTKKGTLFIEPKKRRLKRGGTEVKEIQLYKGMKIKWDI